MDRPAPRRKDLSILRERETVTDRTQISNEFFQSISGDSGMGKVLNQFLIKCQEKIET